MGAKVTNEGKGVTTKTSEHTYISGPPDVCWDPPVMVAVPHVNYVKTDKAIEHTSGKTLFQNGNVVRVGEAIEPSDPAHGDTGAGGGVTSHTYRKEARATKGSPNVRAEGKPPARTDDPTTQNHANTTGTIKQSVSPGQLTDNPEEWLKRCSYKTSTIKCKHHDPVEQLKIDVWRGNTITVKAERYNAKEPKEAVVCAQEPHMKWKVTRTGGVNELGVALPTLEGTFEGDVLVLPEEYTAPLVGFAYEEDQSRNLSDNAKRQYVGMKNARAKELAANRGSSRVEPQDTQQAYKEAKMSIVAKDKMLMESQEQADREKRRDQVQFLASLAQFLVAWRAAQNPVTIMIVGNACTAGISYTVKCYPNSKYSFQLPLDVFVKAGRFVSKAFDFVKTIGRLGNFDVEGSVTVPGDMSIQLEFQWKEQDAKEDEDTGLMKPPPYEIVLEGELAIAGQIFEIKFEVTFPFANLLAIIPAGGALAARALRWVIKKLGADAGVGFGVQIGASVVFGVKIAWSESDKWKFGRSIKIPIDIKVYGFARIRWNSTVLIEFQIFVVADPAFIIKGEHNDKGGDDDVTVGMDDCMVRVGFSGVIHVETWFYTFHEQGQFFPESMTTRIKEIEFGKLAGN